MRYILLTSSSIDVGHILENVVYPELLRRGYVGKLDEDPEADYNVIRRIKALDWLIGTVE